MSLDDMHIDPALKHDAWLEEAQRLIRERDAELYEPQERKEAQSDDK